MTSSASETVCAYCEKTVLTGNEDPEHALPAAINARFTTYAACDPCNRWAGEHIDRPWLNDLFVLGLRFQHQIPDRRGNTLSHDPWLQGKTEDGRLIRLAADGRPELLNSPIDEDKESGEFHISAPDQETLAKMIDRVLKRAGKTRDDLELDEPRVIEDQPRIQVEAKIYPGGWERMAAKATLAFLADDMPEAWRQGESAKVLRQRMRDLNRKANEVALLPAEAFHNFAPPPCSAVVVTDRGGGPAAFVSLLGQFKITIPLGGDLRGVDLAWISDPCDPTRSCSGSPEQVVAERLGLTGTSSA